VKAIVQELIRDLPEKVAFIVCAHRFDIAKHSKNELKEQDLDDSTIFVKVPYNVKDQLKKYCYERKISCIWNNYRKAWKIHTQHADLLVQVKSFVEQDLGGEIL